MNDAVSVHQDSLWRHVRTRFTKLIQHHRQRRYLSVRQETRNVRFCEFDHLQIAINHLALKKFIYRAYDSKILLYHGRLSQKIFAETPLVRPMYGCRALMCYDISYGAETSSTIYIHIFRSLSNKHHSFKSINISFDNSVAKIYSVI